MAKKNSDRFEPDYATSLSNYANRLSELGKTDEALTAAMQALAIRERLAAKNPSRYEANRYLDTCNTLFLAWLAEPTIVCPVPLEVPSKVADHEKPYLGFYLAVVQGCLATNAEQCSAAFSSAYSIWQTLSTAQQNNDPGYYLCVCAWLRQYRPEVLLDDNFEERWQTYQQQRSGNLPRWMQTVAERLQFTWPENPTASQSLGFHLPILPPSLTGLDQPVRRIPFGSPVLAQLSEAHALLTDDGKPASADQLPKDTVMTKTLKIFISYSHAQREYYPIFKDEFIAFAKFPGIAVEVFGDDEIPVGLDWDKHLQGKVLDCDVMVLLVSQQFLNSAYIQEKELGAALNRLQTGRNLLVFPVYFAPCNVQMAEELARLQFFKPHGDDYDEARKGNKFSYIDLVEFRKDGCPNPNPNRLHYMQALIGKMEPQLRKLVGDS